MGSVLSEMAYVQKIKLICSRTRSICFRSAIDLFSLCTSELNIVGIFNYYQIRLIFSFVSSIPIRGCFDPLNIQYWQIWFGKRRHIQGAESYRYLNVPPVFRILKRYPLKKHWKHLAESIDNKSVPSGL